MGFVGQVSEEKPIAAKRGTQTLDVGLAQASGNSGGRGRVTHYRLYLGIDEGLAKGSSVAGGALLAADGTCLRVATPGTHIDVNLALTSEHEQINLGEPERRQRNDR